MDKPMCPMCDDEGEVETGDGWVQRCSCQDDEARTSPTPEKDENDNGIRRTRAVHMKPHITRLANLSPARIDQALIAKVLAIKLAGYCDQVRVERKPI